MSALVPAENFAEQARPLGRQPASPDTPLPPAALVEELDNSGVTSKAEEAEERVTLEFVGDDLPEERFTLRYPFRWEGEVVRSVTVRQLTTGEVGRLVTAASRQGRLPELMDVYATMTGLPAKVLKAMPSVDTDPIIGKAYDFLPPFYRPESG